MVANKFHFFQRISILGHSFRRPRSNSPENWKIGTVIIFLSAILLYFLAQSTWQKDAVSVYLHLPPFFLFAAELYG